jgi:hypothetical protein
MCLIILITVAEAKMTDTLDRLQAELDALRHQQAQGKDVRAEIAHIETLIANIGSGTVNIDKAAGRDMFNIYGEDPEAARHRYHTYLSDLARRWKALPLGNIVDMLQEQREEIKLAQVWTPLDTLTIDRPEGIGRAEHHLDPEDMEARRVPALEMVDRARRLVLLGDPGAGKTTVVRYIALCLAGAELVDTALELDLSNLAPWSHGKLCPVYVELREFAVSEALRTPPASDALLRFILERCQASESLRDFAPDLAQKLHAGECVVLLDGLDEVPDKHAHRGRVLDAVNGLVGAFGKCRFIVTSRTYAYQRGEWKLPGFTETTLAPFSPEQVTQFVDRWYAQMVLRYPERHLEGRTEQLKREITSRPTDLGRLAERPLLLTVMASLHSYRSDPLPAARARLYDEISRLLLQKWEQQKCVTDEATGETVLQVSSLADFLGKGTGYDDLRKALGQVGWCRRIWGIILVGPG